MNMALTNEQKQEFETDGYLIVRNLLTQSEVKRVKRRADLIASGEAEHVPSQLIQQEPAIHRREVVAKSKINAVRKLGNLARHDEVMRAHATNPKIVDVIADLIGSDIKLLGDQLFMKPAGHGSRKPYHQDSKSWTQIIPYSLVSCWAALDDATVENGCLWVIPGSHKWGLLGEKGQQEIEKKAILGRANNEVPVELKVGDCSFHHSLLLHSSHANRSSKRRRGYATHYMSAKSRDLSESAKRDYPLIRGVEFPGCV